jgi:hypothetical protein
MKFVKSLVAVAALSAGFAAHAESNFATGSGALSTTGRLDVSVVVPKVIFLQVGTGSLMTVNTTVDTVTFTLTTGNVGSGASVAAGATVATRVLSTGGDVSLTANGVSGGPATGGNSIAWSQFSATSSNAALPHPGTIGNGVAGTAATLTATAGVFNQSANWTFNYANTNVMAAGTYTGRVTYTASIL